MKGTDEGNASGFTPQSDITGTDRYKKRRGYNIVLEWGHENGEKISQKINHENWGYKVEEAYLYAEVV